MADYLRILVLYRRACITYILYCIHTTIRTTIHTAIHTWYKRTAYLHMLIHILYLPDCFQRPKPTCESDFNEISLS